MMQPYRVPADLHLSRASARGAPVDWSWVALRAAALAFGFLAIPTLVARLALEDHSVLPGIFVAYGALAGGSLAVLFVRVMAPSRR